MKAADRIERRSLPLNEFLRHREGLFHWFFAMTNAGFSKSDLDAEIVVVTDALQAIRDLPRPNDQTRVGGGR